MFKRTIVDKRTGLQKARDDLFCELQGYESHEPQYQKILENVKMLTNLIDLEKPKLKRERLSPNTIWLVLGNAVVAVIVVGYEQKNVVTSKFQSFQMKFK